jgi:hypothetical protein
MKYLAAGVRQITVVPIALLSLLALPPGSINAADPQGDRDLGDQAAIRATVTDYIEGYYLNDAARMERSLHPHFLKHTISGSKGELTIIDNAGMEIVQEVRTKEKVTPVSERKEEITIFASDGDVASVKLVATAWTNYMTLLKQNGAWKILSVVKRNQD